MESKRRFLWISEKAPASSEIWEKDPNSHCEKEVHLIVPSIDL